MMSFSQLFLFGRQRKLPGSPLLIRPALGDEFILELGHETLNRPGTGLAKRTNRTTTGNIVGNLDEIIRVSGTAFAMGKSMERLVHPK